MIIYKTTNLINNLIYIGQHYTSAEDGYFGSGKYLISAIKEFSKENFKREVLEFIVVGNQKFIDEREIYWINKLQSRNEKIGYNILSGGRGVMGESNPFYGKTHSEETKKHYSRIRKNRGLGKENTFYGKKHKISSLIKIGASSKLRTKYLYKIITIEGKIENINNLQDFCDKLEWSPHNIRFSKRKNIVNYKGFTIERKLKNEITD